MKTQNGRFALPVSPRSKQKLFEVFPARLGLWKSSCGVTFSAVMSHRLEAHENEALQRAGGRPVETGKASAPSGGEGFPLEGGVQRAAAAGAPADLHRPEWGQSQDSTDLKLQGDPLKPSWLLFNQSCSVRSGFLQLFKGPSAPNGRACLRIGHERATAAPIHNHFITLTSM